jgi:hypothetical protein
MARTAIHAETEGHPVCPRSATAITYAVIGRDGGIPAAARRWNSYKTGHAEAIYPPGSPYVYLLEWQMRRETARGRGREVAMPWDRRRRGAAAKLR